MELLISTSVYKGTPTTFTLRRGIAVPRFWFFIAQMELECTEIYKKLKKVLFCIVFICVALCVYAQNDVTQFLGIPVDGSKSAMVQKLKAKGFRPNPLNNEILEGEFNGTSVNIYIVTNGDKVYRIVVCDANPIDERSIHIRFNNLCRQFEMNPKYLSIRDNMIPEDEDISYNMSVKKKRYEAAFCQRLADLSDSTLIQEGILSILSEKYTPEQIANPTEDIKEDIMSISQDYIKELCLKKPVWFMISEFCGKYYISMFYDK